MVRAAIGQPVNQPRVAVKREEDRFVPGEQGIEVLIAQPVRVFAFRLQLHQVHNVDHANLQLGQVVPKDGNGGERFQRGYVTATGHHDVRFGCPIASRPFPDADPLGAVFYGRRHGQPLRRLVFAGDHDVDVVAAPEAMVPHRQQAVGVGRQVHAHDGRLLVDHMIDEAGVLMREAVMGLLPDMRGEQVVQRGDLATPGKLRADLQPLGMLVEHRIDDVDERLVAVEEAMPPGEQIAFEPAFALMLAQHFHHAAVGCQKLIMVSCAGFPLPVGDLKHGIQPVGQRFVGAEDAEVSLLAVEARQPRAETRPVRACRRPERRPATGHPPHSRESRA